MTLIVFMLNIVPCCAWENSEAEEMKQVTSENATKHEDDCKNCSPFYACGNCMAALEIPLIVKVTQETSYLIRIFNREFVFSFTEGINTSVWQPPKFS